MWARASRLLLLLLLVSCGARSDVASPDAGGDALAPELIGTWWFPLATNGPRWYVLTLCPDGRAGLRTSFGCPGPRDCIFPGLFDASIRGGVRPSSGDVDVIASFPSADAPPGFSTMRLRHDRATDRLQWLEEVEVFGPYVASGGGLRDPFDWIEASSAPACE